MEEREVATLALGVVVAIVTLARRRSLSELPSVGYLLGAGGCLLVAWTATVLEHIFYAQALNVIEHAAYAAQSLLLVGWLLKLPRPAPEADGPVP